MGWEVILLDKFQCLTEGAESAQRDELTRVIYLQGFLKFEVRLLTKGNRNVWLQWEVSFLSNLSYE